MKTLAIILSLWIAFQATVYLHEWTHSTVAWAAGYKESPFDIYYGKDWAIHTDIDDETPYTQIKEDGKNGLGALIAILPVAVDALMALAVIQILKYKLNKWLSTLLFWFGCVNLGEVYAYIPIRALSGSADIYDFLFFTNLSPMVVFVPGTLFAIWGIRHYLTVETPQAMDRLKITSQRGRFAFYFLASFLFFVFFAWRGFTQPFPIAHFFSILSFCIFPCVLSFKTWKKTNG